MKKYFKLSIILIVLFFLGAGIARALEVKYPNIPGLDPLGDKPSLPDFVAYWFGLLVYLAGALSLISFVVGAVGLLNPNVEAHGDAKDRMKGAVLGLILTLASFVILKTINPVLVNPTLTPLPGGPGVYWYNGKEKRPVAEQVEDVPKRGDDLIAGGFNRILYDCTGKGEGSGGTGPDLLIWEFTKPGLESNNDFYDIHTRKITCGQARAMTGIGSFRWIFESPGVYYCFGAECDENNMCLAYMSNAITGSQDVIGSPFTGHVAGVRIVNDSANNTYYGIIFHNEMGLENGGLCNAPIINTSILPDCLKVDKPDYTAAADIFKLNNTPISSGNGVVFYSEPQGWNVGTESGYKEIPSDKILFPVEGASGGSTIANEWLPGKGSSFRANMCFDYTKVVVPDEYRYKCLEDRTEGEGICPKDWSEDKACSTGACESFQDCPGSIKIKGSYLVGLYSGSGDKLYCQTFTKDVADLNAEPFLPDNAAKTDFNKVYIFPTK